MGMIFNSINTLKILEMLNGRYSDTNLSPAIRANDIGVLNDATKPHLYEKSVAMQINLPVVPGHKNNWQLYLENIENHSSAVGILIVQNMLRFLNDNNCLAIEFYAIEATVRSVYISTNPPANAVIAPATAPTPAGTPYFASILVESPTFNNAVAWERGVIRRPGKGKHRHPSPGVRAPGASPRRKKPEE